MVSAGDAEPPLQLQLQSKNVCVVGAGMAGMAAARELRREGHAVTVIEQSTDVGGQWLYDPRTDGNDPLGATVPVRVPGSMYACLRLISPREAMGFSDFQFLPRHGIAGRDPRRYPRPPGDVLLPPGLLRRVRAHGRRQAQHPCPARRRGRANGVVDASVGGEIRAPRRWQREGGGVRRRGGGHRALLAAEAPVHQRHGGMAAEADAQPLVPDAGDVLRRGGGDGGVWGQRQGHRAGPAPRGQGGAPHRQVHGGGHDAGHVQDAGQPRQPAPPPADRPAARRRLRGVRRRFKRRRRHGHVLHGVHLLVPVPGHGRRGDRGRQPRRPAVRARVPAVPGAVALLRRRAEEGHCSVVLRGAGEVGRAGAVRPAGAAAGGGDAWFRGGSLPRQGGRRRAQEVHPRHRRRGTSEDVRVRGEVLRLRADRELAEGADPVGHRGHERGHGELPRPHRRQRERPEGSANMAQLSCFCSSSRR
ncbi:hypothetical protein ACQ4PT_050933 [Festuca glaucescens]